MGAIGLGVKPLDVVNLWMPRELFAPSPLAQILELGGTRFEALSTPVEIWRRGYKCVYSRSACIRASSYSPPGQARGCSTNHSRLAQANTILRLSRLSTSYWGYQILGTTLYMMALNRVLDWKRYFAHSIPSDQWLGSKLATLAHLRMTHISQSIPLPSLDATPPIF